MSKFKIGDKVRCINAGRLSNQTGMNLPRLREGAIYVVLDVRHCSKCSLTILDVGLPSSDNSSGYATCHQCGNRYLSDGNVHWASSKRFVKEIAKTEIRYVAVPCDVKMEEFSHN